MSLTTDNEQRWANCKVNSSKQSVFNSVAARLSASKARYQTIEAKTGVPWYVIAVIHEREASQSWNANIAQGDRWDRVSTHVPAGRGPFKSFEEAAYDALVNCGPYAARNKDWSPGGTLALLEKYNGLGYAKRGRPSPYIWAGTNQYTSGKYVADGVYDPNAVDTQLGCAGLLMAMGAFKQTSVPIVHPTVKGPSAVVIAGGAAVASTPHNYWPYIIVGTIVAAIVTAIAIHFYNKGK